MRLVDLAHWPWVWWEKRKIRQDFSQYLSPDLVEALRRDPEELRPGAEPHIITFLIVAVRDDEPAAAIERIASSHKLILTYPCMIDVQGSVMFVWFGTPAPGNAADEIEQCEALVAELTAHYGSDAKLLYGQREGLVGNIGSDRHLKFGAMVSGYAGLLHLLSNLAFGQSQRI